MEDKLWYETKCRRCDIIHTWAWLNTWDLLHIWVCDHFASPSANYCDRCEMQTIQDYVSYSTNPIK